MNLDPGMIRERLETGCWPDGAAHVDGRYVPIADARISVLDFGFTRSDACYDVVHVHDGAFFRLDDHLRRFRTSLAGVRMSVRYDDTALTAILAECVRLTGHRDSYVAMVCTRGVPPARVRGAVTGIPNTFIAYALPWIDVLSAEIQQRGAHVMIASTPRIPSESVDPTIKNYNRGDMVRALFEAEDAGADTAILLDLAGHVTEGPGFNVFAVSGNSVRTPASGALEGVTRLAALELCAELGLDATTADLTPDDLHDADEVFLTSTAGGIIAVTRIDNRILSNDSPGPITRRITDLYWKWHRNDQHATPVAY